MRSELLKKINVMRLFTEQSEYNYKQPTMNYDKETGEVVMGETKDKKKKKKIISNLDEIHAQKKKLYDELGLDNDGLPKGKNLEDVNVDELGEKLK